MFEGGLVELLENTILPILEPIFDLHILGWCRQLWDLIDIFNWYGHRIRSIDSAKPIVYGLSNIRLDPAEGIPKYPVRQKDFFETPIPSDKLVSVWHNISIFEGIAQGSFPEVENGKV